jgi:hypothetical protein
VNNSLQRVLTAGVMPVVSAGIRLGERCGMQSRFAILAGSVILLTALPAYAVDYDKLDRKLTKEPTYQTKNPRYALLLFGPEGRLPIWVALDGEVLYVDLNSDGDLTAPNECFAKEADFKPVELVDPDRKTRYVLERIRTDHSFYTDKVRQEREKNGIPPGLMADVSIKGPIDYQQYCEIVEMGNGPKKAMLAHFHGPLTIRPMLINWKLPESAALRKGKNPVEFIALVGTMSERHGCWVVVRTCDDKKCLFPDGVRPVAEIEFPSSDLDSKPIKKTYTLNGYRCGAAFRENIPVPDTANPGTAKVTLSFDAWKAGRVLPSTTEIPVRVAEKKDLDKK